MEDEPLMRTSAAARALGIDPSTLYRWERAGIVAPETRTAGGQARWRVTPLRRQVEAHAARTRGEPEPEPAPEPEPKPKRRTDRRARAAVDFLAPGQNVGGLGSATDQSSSSAGRRARS
jgi:hypothetical protein